MTWDVFLSYGHDERPLAQSLANALRHEGLSVWFDEAIRPGDSPEKQISAAATAARSFVVVVPSHPSLWTEWELRVLQEGSRTRGVPLIPVWHDTMDLSANPPFLMDLMAANLSSGRADVVQVAKDITAAVQRYPATEAAPSEGKPEESSRVFLSYAHDRSVPGHAQRALDLTDSLRERGVDAWIDRYDEHSGVHWPRWMKDQVKRAQFVLCLASPLYRERFEQAGGTPDVGRGARWEGAIITEELYEQQQVGPKKFIAVVMPGTSSEDIPDVLNPIGWTHYTLPDDDESLYRRLTNQPAVVPPPLGPTIRFPPGRS